MAFSSKTITSDALLVALEKSPSNTITFKKKKVPEGKKYKCEYYDTAFQLDPSETAQGASIYARDLLVISGPVDPNGENAYANDNNSKTASVICSGSNSGSYGKVVKIYDIERRRQLSADEFGLADMKFCPMYTEKYSRKANEKYAGKNYPNPKNKDESDWRFVITLDFDTYPNMDKIPESKRGKPKSIIKDFRTGKVNEETGQIEYELLTVDGKPVDYDNVHKAIGNGTIIEEIYVDATSTSVSQFGVSTRQTAIEIIVTPADRSDYGKLDTVDNSALLEKIRKLQEAKQAAEDELAKNKAAAAAAAPAPSLDAIEEHIDEGLAAPELAEDIADALEDI